MDDVREPTGLRPTKIVADEAWDWVEESEADPQIDVSELTVTAVLVTHNAVAWLPEALQSLRSLTVAPRHLVAVDTDSDDATLDLLQDSGLCDLGLAGSADDGFGSAVAKGLHALRADRSDDTRWLWLLNDDIVVYPDALRRLLECAVIHPDADVIGPKLLQPAAGNGPRRISELGVSISDRAVVNPASSRGRSTSSSTRRMKVSGSAPAACSCAAACSTPSTGSPPSSRFSATASSSAGGPPPPAIASGPAPKRSSCIAEPAGTACVRAGPSAPTPTPQIGCWRCARWRRIVAHSRACAWFGAACSVRWAFFSPRRPVGRDPNSGPWAPSGIPPRSGRCGLASPNRLMPRPRIGSGHCGHPGGRASAWRRIRPRAHPDARAAVVDLILFGPTGIQSASGARGIAVPARSVRTVALESLFTRAEPVGVQVRADTGRVAAVAKQYATAGAQSVGTDWQVEASAPATHQIVPGVPGGPGSRALVLSNPGSRRTTATVEVLASDGTFAPADAGTVDVNGESTAAVGLEQDLGGDAGAVRIVSDQPLIASVVSRSSEDAATSDIALQPATQPLGATGMAAVAGAPGVRGTLLVSNGGDADAAVGVRLVGVDGTELLASELRVAPGTTIDRVDEPVALHVRAPGTARLHAGIVLTSKSDPEAGLATTPLSVPQQESGGAVAPVHDPDTGR